MKAFQAIIRLYNMPRAYTSAMVRNIIFSNLLDNGPWHADSTTVIVEDLRELPDLRGREALSEEELSHLQELREILSAQREATNDLLARIADRINTTYGSAATMRISIVEEENYEAGKPAEHRDPREDGGF